MFKKKIKKNKSDNKKEKKEKKQNSSQKSVLEFIPIRYYDTDKNYFVCQDGSICNIFKIVSQDIIATNDDDIEYEILKWTQFFRIFSEDIKIIGINLPTDCRKQITYLDYKINHTKDAFRIKNLEIKKQELTWIEKHRTTKNYYLIVFSDKNNYFELYSAVMRNLAENPARKQIIEIDQFEKEMLLEKLNNHC